MKLRTLRPPPAVARFVHHFWVFESDDGLPAGDARVVVPNGRPKLIVPLRNALEARAVDDTRVARHGEPIVVGLWEKPTIIASDRAPTTTIGVELVPEGLARFFDLDARELSGAIVPVADVLGRAGRDLASRVSGAASVAEAVALVEAFLLERLAATKKASTDVVSAAVRLLRESGGALRIDELERRVGYSRRHLHALFLRDVGLAPKKLAGVLAFERLYRSFSVESSVAKLRSDALDVFYDESHFVRTFRRFTGYSPGRFAELSNEFGRIFYLPTR